MSFCFVWIKKMQQKTYTWSIRSSGMGNCLSAQQWGIDLPAKKNLQFPGDVPGKGAGVHGFK